MRARKAFSFARQNASTPAVGNVSPRNAAARQFHRLQEGRTLIKNGSVVGVIDLGSGGDHFTGGANSETVSDGDGTDVYNLGGGNDHYIATGASGSDGTDTVNGGSVVDTYDASAASSTVTVNLDTKDHFIYLANTAFGTDVGFANTVIGFENAIGAQTMTV
jgi:hypothetical protein